MIPSDRERNHEYRPEFEENPSPGGPTDPEDDPDPDRELDEYRDSGDISEPSSGFKGLQLGCGAFIIIALALAIIVPLAGTFGGGGDDGVPPGGAACSLFLDLVVASPEGIPIDGAFIGSVGDIADIAADAGSAIRDSSAALFAAASGLTADITESQAADLSREIDIQGSNLIQACVDAGYLSPLG